MADGTRHFETLDALRGLAAVVVVLGHLGNYQTFHIVPKHYLAVDFFFILSGVVIARAYEAQLIAGGAWRFMLKRVIRLYPLIALSMVFALMTEASKSLVTHAASAIPLGHLPMEFLCGLLLLPHLTGPATASMFPLNLPLWSLFFEVAANLLYAFAAPHLTTRRLVAVVVISGFCLLAADVSHGNICFGWTPADAYLGLARVMFAFPLGILLYRLYARGWFDRLPRISGLWLAVLLLVVFSRPDASGVWFDPVCLAFILPAIVVMGSFDELPARARPGALLLGRLSYPIYVLHWPVVYRNGYHLIAKTHGWTLGLAAMFDVAAIFIVAWLALRFFDEPVRAYLTRRFVAAAPPRGVVLLARQEA